MAVQVLFCGVLFSGLVQNSTQDLSVIIMHKSVTIKLRSKGEVKLCDNQIILVSCPSLSLVYNQILGEESAIRFTQTCIIGNCGI